MKLLDTPPPLFLSSLYLLYSDFWVDFTNKSTGIVFIFADGQEAQQKATRRREKTKAPWPSWSFHCWCDSHIAVWHFVLGRGAGSFPLLGSKQKVAKHPQAAQTTQSPKAVQQKKNKGKKGQPNGQLNPSGKELSSEEDEGDEEEEATWDARKPAKVAEMDSNLDFPKQGDDEGDDEGDEGEEEEEEEEELEEEESSDDEESEQQGKKQPQPKAKRVPIEKTIPPRTFNKDNSQQDAAGTVYVNQLPYTATKEQITEHFKPCGVSEVRMCFKDDSFRGTAFVVVGDTKKALTLHQSKLGGRVINVRPQLSREGLAAVAERGRTIRKNLPSKQGGVNKKKSNKKN